MLSPIPVETLSPGFGGSGLRCRSVGHPCAFYFLLSLLCVLMLGLRALRLSRHYAEALDVLEYTRAPSNVITWSPRSISPHRRPLQLSSSSFLMLTFAGLLRQSCIPVPRYAGRAVLEYHPGCVWARDPLDR